MGKITQILLLSLLALIIILSLTGCSNKKTENTVETADGIYQEISPAEVKKILDSGEKIILLDVRTKEEYDEGHIPKSILLPYTEIDEKAAKLLPDKNASIIVYCRSGRRSKIAAKMLLRLGYTKIADMGGINRWTYDLEK